MSAIPVFAVTNARFAPLHRLSVGPDPLTTAPVPLLKPCARHERHSHCAARAACFRLRLGGGVALRLRFVRCSSSPALHFPARRPQTEAFVFAPSAVAGLNLEFASPFKHNAGKTMPNPLTISRLRANHKHGGGADCCRGADCSQPHLQTAILS
jgi:hypothetical protein